MDDDESNNTLHPFWKWRIRHGLDMNIQQNNQGNHVNTLQLGSYKPRSEKKSSHAAIGKSIRKSRYSKEVLSHVYKISELEEISNGNNGWDEG